MFDTKKEMAISLRKVKVFFEHGGNREGIGGK